MDNFVSNFGGWIGIGAAVVMGALALLGLFDKRVREKKAEEDLADDRLIKILKETITELQAKVVKLESDRDKQGKEILALQTENKTLIAVLQGRDEDTKKYQAKVFQAIDTAEKTHTIVIETNGHMKKLLELMEKHLASIEVAMKT